MRAIRVYRRSSTATSNSGTSIPRSVVRGHHTPSDASTPRCRDRARRLGGPVAGAVGSVADGTGTGGDVGSGVGTGMAFTVAPRERWRERWAAARSSLPAVEADTAQGSDPLPSGDADDPGRAITSPVEATPARPAGAGATVPESETSAFATLIRVVVLVVTFRLVALHELPRSLVAAHGVIVVTIVHGLSESPFRREGPRRIRL